MANDTRRTAGRRLKEYVLDRMGEGDVATLLQLADEADVDYDTLHAWFRGRAPSPKAGGKVANVLGVTYSELLAAYEGRVVSATIRDDAELRRVIDAAAEAAVRRVLAERNGKGRP